MNEQQGAVQCQQYHRWFRSRGGLAVPIDVYQRADLNTLPHFRLEQTWPSNDSFTRGQVSQFLVSSPDPTPLKGEKGRGQASEFLVLHCQQKLDRIT